MFFNKKNKESKMIIVYHNDDTEGIKYAKLLTLKGFFNVYIVTRGIEEFGALYKENIVGLEIPEFEELEPSKIKRNDFIE